MKNTMLGVIVLCACAGAASADPWTPDAATIAKFEAAIHIPDWGRSTEFPNGHVPAVSEYARYYAGDISPNGSGGRRIVFAELVVLGPGVQPGTHLVSTIAGFPQISDGGCTVVNLIYDVDQDKVIGLRCNGRG
jgi:hypothetical protein